jgi:hypothetical protein
MSENPDIAKIEEYLKHAEARMMQAEFADDAGRVELYQESTDLLIRSERIMKGSGAWLMACIHARQQNQDMCLQWLERALGARMLPDVEEIRTHVHFSQVKDAQWFTEWARVRGKR